MKPDHTAEIAKRAYALWDQEGRPMGRDIDHWLQAEAEVMSTQRMAQRAATGAAGAAGMKQRAAAAAATAPRRKSGGK